MADKRLRKYMVLSFFVFLRFYIYIRVVVSRKDHGDAKRKEGEAESRHMRAVVKQ